MEHIAFVKLAMCSAGPALSLLHLDGCLYLVRPDALLVQTTVFSTDPIRRRAFITGSMLEGEARLALASGDTLRVCTIASSAR